MLVSVVFYVWAGGVSRLLGRDFTIGGYRNLYLFPGFSALWVEIYNRQYWGSLPISGFPAFWVEICDRRLQESLPFRPIFAIWVEISERRLRDSLPFSPVSRLLGRDFQPAALGISTFFPGFPHFG